jgi:FtsP/CotA-like multicopper oxidase with cupredoxin domain
MKNCTLPRNTVLAVLLLLAINAFAQPTFINKIPIPPIVDAQNGTIKLVMEKKFHKFNPSNPSDTLNGGSAQPNGIPTYAYNVPGVSNLSILGPTLKWYTGQQTEINVTNRIGVHTSTHWHGAELPPYMDGGPHQPIQPDETWTAPDFPVLDSACTMWYHPHFHNHTLQHVQRGLSGMILVEQPGDPIRNTLPHTYGVDDIPVIIGDLSVKRNTPWPTPATSWNIDTLKGKRPINIVNGVTNPYLEVPAHLVRLRILNGSTRKGIILGVSNEYNDSNANLKDFTLIATDGGYTLEPNVMKTLLNGPGARDEIILDLSNYQVGDKLYLRNLKELIPNTIVGSTLAPPNPPGGGGKDSTLGNAFIQLRIVADSQFPGYSPITSFTPFTTVWSPGLADTSNVTKRRTKQLKYEGTQKYTIDGSPYELNVINDTVCVNSKEIWTIHNVSPIAHPFHIHKIQFRILDILDKNNTYVDLKSHGFNGPKDDVLVLPGWKLRFLGQFDDYPSPIMPELTYMYHCHILTHEDSLGGGMMHQFIVTNEGACLSSIDEAESKKPTMELFPNPSTGILHLKGQSNYPSKTSILDLQGRLMREQQIPALDGNATINIDGLPNGLYFVEWRTQRGVVTGKLVVQR